jgi:hypothetical protein
MMQDAVLRSMQTALARVFQPLTSVPPAVATVDDAGALTGVLLEFPMGWRVLHVPCVEETGLAAPTDAAAHSGVDVVWWLGGAADTPTRRRWQRARNGYTIRLDLDRDPPVGRVVLSEDPATAPFDLEVGVVEDIVASRWKHQALVRFFELWGPANRDRFVRALAGTHKLLGSFSGMIGFLNTQRAVVKGADGAWLPVSPTSVYPYVARWPEAGLQAARARAWARSATPPTIRAQDEPAGI